MTGRSDLTVRSNLMVDDQGHQPETAWLPGDLLAVKFPEWADSRVIEKYFGPLQLEEYREQLVCLRCSRPCAGTCVLT